MNATCLICQRSRPRESCHVIVLTEAERAQVPDPRDEYVYCKPCWKVLSDPVQGASLMGGLAQHYLQHLGVEGVSERVTRFRDKLIARSKAPRA